MTSRSGSVRALSDQSGDDIRAHKEHRLILSHQQSQIKLKLQALLSSLCASSDRACLIVGDRKPNFSVPEMIYCIYKTLVFYLNSGLFYSS